MKKHGDATRTFHYLKTFNKTPRGNNGSYESLSKLSLYEFWFTWRRKKNHNWKLLYKKVIYSMVTKICFSIIKIVMLKILNTIYLNIT
jgi:hypothetical protein